jgi:hypothetical protein
MCPAGVRENHPKGELDTASFAESECFEAEANVIYTHQYLGMGLVFQEISLQSGNLLRQWLVKGIST